MVISTIQRLVRHLLMTPWQVRRAFSRGTLDTIKEEIAASERLHAGQIRFAVEGALPIAKLLNQQSTRGRALEVFSLLRVWDTEHNNGVLIYVLLAVRVVEIIADRGIHSRVNEREWISICEAMEARFQIGNFEAGAVEGIRSTTQLLAGHFPPTSGRRNELPDRPVVW